MNQKEVLMKMLKFYQKKSQTDSIASDFTKAILDLIECGDIEQSVFDEFCRENGIKIPKDKKTAYGNSRTSRRNITSWNDYTRSSC
jgi:hypothetical protein